MSKLAFLFPGQASQYPGMGRDLFDHFPESRAVFEEADDALGFSISKICFEGSEEDLKLTENTQPAILTVSVAAFRALESRGIVPDFAAGHSLGEYSALVAAGAMTFSDAVKLARRRGSYMQAAVPAGEGAMAAILGLSPSDVAEVCKKAADNEIVSPANLNSPEQTVISGQRERRETRRGNRLAERRQTLGDAAGFRAVSLRADEARAGSLRKGFARHKVFCAAISGGHQCGCRSHHVRGRSARSADPANYAAGALA